MNVKSMTTEQLLTRRNEILDRALWIPREDGTLELNESELSQAGLYEIIDELFWRTRKEHISN